MLPIWTTRILWYAKLGPLQKCHQGQNIFVCFKTKRDGANAFHHFDMQGHRFPEARASKMKQFLSKKPIWKLHNICKLFWQHRWAKNKPTSDETVHICFNSTLRTILLCWWLQSILNQSIPTVLQITPQTDIGSKYRIHEGTLDM